MRPTALFTTVLVLMLFSVTYGQELPNKIRGYKVHNIKVAVKDQTGQTTTKDKADILVKLDEPEVSVNGLFSVAIEVVPELTAMRQSGKIDFVTFRDVRINGIAVEIEEYRNGFLFTKNVPVLLPKPVRSTISIVGIAKAAYKELIESKKEWSVTGTVFVFGRFNRFGLSFKRVIPVKIDMKIKNSLTV